MAEFVITSGEGNDAIPEGYVPSHKEAGRYLPPISRIKLPKTQTQSALVRWLFELGYETKEIARGLNVRYQQVRNMITTIPKRAAREDLPPLHIELLEMEDAVETLLGIELERTHSEARKAEKREHKQAERRAREAAATNFIVQRAKSEEDFGNEDLDDENYGR